ncbi:unnamed protein product [Plutella xylostella]|uniref:(diamondback moth) hypothetical protein n=1 Tax=Plutella xylostella TaxID=51655 RepID=A0A8S4FY68_PLUXY|nr:unnamed protein product [Plutella xylostella]
MKKKMDVIEQEKKRDREYILFLEDKVEDLQKASRKCSMELKNVPKIKNENKEILSTMVTHLSSQLKVDLETKDIKDIYRTSSKADKTPIVVEFSSYILKTDLMNAAKKYNIMNKNNKLNASHLGQQSNSTPIYLSDHLTQKGSRLFYLARELSKAQNYKYCWTSLGNVFIRKDENAPIIKIINESQIQRLSENIK